MGCFKKKYEGNRHLPKEQSLAYFAFESAARSKKPPLQKASCSAAVFLEGFKKP